MQNLSLCELVGALSAALDMTEGQPRGHCVRSTWIGMTIAQALGLDDAALWNVYYTILLKDLGCSSNAARICALYLTDDLSFKRDFKLVGNSLPQVAHFVLTHTGLKAGLVERFRATMDIFRSGGEIAHELIQTRCQRGSDITKKLHFGNEVARGVYELDEHWDGSGKPDGLVGDNISIFARLALLAQVVDVFHTAGGPQAAIAEVLRRRGSWFDPRLTEAFEGIAADPGFWTGLADKHLPDRVYGMEPANTHRPLDEDYLDDIAEAFGQIIDAKSPYTSGHSVRVALYTDLIAGHLGMPDDRRRWLRRGALLHDLGKLGVSNTVLDKPGSLDAQEWEAVRMHPVYTETILAGIAPFAELARMAGAHHERLDGKGYPRGLRADQISLETRIITTADIFDALSAERPYRPAIPLDKALDMMGKIVGSALDARCMDALRHVSLKTA